MYNNGFIYMALSLNYKFLLSSSAVSALMCYIINLVVSQALWFRQSTISLWGEHGLASYLTTSSMLFSFTITFVVTKYARNAIRNNTLLPLHWHLKSQTIIDQLPTLTVHRAFILGIVGAMLAGLTIFLLHTKRFLYFEYAQFAAFSLVYYMLLATAVAVMAAYRAMGDNVLRQSSV